MANHDERKILRDYVVPFLTAATSCIMPPTIQANNFELKSGLIQIVQHTGQFGGLTNDDPNEYIASSLEICGKQRINDVSMEVIKLKLFLSL